MSACGNMPEIISKLLERMGVASCQSQLLHVFLCQHVPLSWYSVNLDEN